MQRDGTISLPATRRCTSLIAPTGHEPVAARGIVRSWLLRQHVLHVAA
jgi:hypothetical protein